MSVDEAYDVAEAILTDAAARIDQIRSEEDAKLQVITRLLTEALGWSHSDISSEQPNANGFSDYLISAGERGAFVVEAKRIGEILLSTQTHKKGYYKLSGPVIKSAQVGVKQVASYCHPLGVPLAVLTDGIVWIIFSPWVYNSSYLEKQAIVFNGVQSILDDFSEFYELLSKHHHNLGTFKVIFDSINENRLVLDRDLNAPIHASSNVIVQKSGLAFDLESVFSSFFSNLAGDSDPEMLVECFVETRESRIADFTLERLTQNVLGNIAPAERDVGEGLREIGSGLIDQSQKMTVAARATAEKKAFGQRS